MCTLFLPQGVKIKLNFALQAAVFETRADFQNCHIWAWNLELKKVPEVAYAPSFYPRGSKLSLFLLYWQQFPRYGPIFKIAIFGHETWNLKKVPKVVYAISFYPSGSKLSLLLLYGQRFLRYGPIFNIAIFGYETWNLKKSAGSCIWTFFLPHGSTLSSFSLYRKPFSRYSNLKSLINIIN